jgi:hypothetical protein
MARYAAYAAIAYMGLANFPVRFLPIEAGVDGSWIFALNALAAEGGSLGREVFFTYGPLGFLLEPRAIGSNLAIGSGFWLAVHVLLIAFLVAEVRRGKAWESAGLSVVLVLSMGIGYWDEYLILLVVGLLSMAAHDGQPRGAVWGAFAGALAALCLFMKFTLGIAAAATVLISVAVFRTRKTGSWRDSAWTAATYFMTAGALAAWHFQSGAEAARWLEMSWEITRGYGLAMTLFGSRVPLVEAGLALVSLGILFWRTDGGQRRALLVFAPALGMSYKHAFVRQDWHTFAFFCFLPLASAASTLFAGRAVRWVRWFAFGISSLTLAVAVSHWGLYREAPKRDAAHLWRHVSLRTGSERTMQLVRLGETTATLEAQAAGDPSNRRMREDWAADIRASGGVAIGVPYEVTSIALQEMRWARLPTVQMYSAFTPKLDSETAAYFASSAAPEWIWIRMWNINEGHLLLNNPKTWGEILRRYHVTGVDEPRGEVLLRKSEEVRVPPARVQEQGEVRANEWVTVRGGDDVRAAFDVKYNSVGSVLRFLYKLPPVYLEFEREDGSQGEYRFPEETARGGVMISKLPMNARELADVVDGKPIPEVSRLRLKVSLPSLTARRIGVTWILPAVGVR